MHEAFGDNREEILDWVENKDTREVIKALIRQWTGGKNGYQKVVIIQFCN